MAAGPGGSDIFLLTPDDGATPMRVWAALIPKVRELAGDSA